MHLHLIFVGKTSFPEMDTGIRRYLDRLSHYLPTQVHIVKAEKISARGSEDLVRQREAERILKLVGKQDHLVVWDQRGKPMASTDFALFLRDLMERGVSGLRMVIGGPLGISSELLGRANTVIALSRMTFPHDLARLMVVEQLYRAFTILKGEPYHK